MAPFEEIGDRVFRRRYPSLDLNIGVVLGDDQAMVVDSRASHRQADELLDEIAGLTRLPVSHLINTHWHWDHVWGNARFGGSVIWGHERTRIEIVERGAAERTRVLEWISHDLHDDVREVVLTAPDRIMVAVVDLIVGGRSVELRYHGRAHTDADIVIHVPDAGVSFVGDMIEQGAPPSFGDSYPLEWPVTVGTMLPTLQETVVPGHGDVVDLVFVENQKSELELVAEIVRTVAGGSDPVAGLRAMPYPDESGRSALRRGVTQLTGRPPDL